MIRNTLTGLVLTACVAVLPARAAEPGEALREAAKSGDLETVKALLGEGADPDAASEYGATPLIFAAGNGHAAVVETLLAHGADVNLSDTFYGSSPISWAAYNGHGEIVRALLQHAAHDLQGALNTAIFRGHAGVVETIVAWSKADPKVLGAALSTAREAGRAEIVELLETAGASPPPAAGSKVAMEVLQAYTGSYTDEQGNRIDISLEDERLLVNFFDQATLELDPVDEKRFRPVGAPRVLLTFRTEGDKAVAIGLEAPDGTSTYERSEESQAEAAE